MPEMPEVEAVRAYLAERLRDRVITRIDVTAVSALKTFDPPLESLYGLPISDVCRHGKFIDIDAQGIHLLFHLARAGWIRWSEQQPMKPARPGKGALAMRVVLDDGSGFDLTEAGTKKGLSVYVVADIGQVPGIAALGPEPLSEEFDAAALAAILKEAGRSYLKTVLRSQRLIAGIGNAYSDEILHRAKLAPTTQAASLDDAEVQVLYEATVAVLADAVDRAGELDLAALKDDKRDHLRVHGRTGEDCPVCGDLIAELSSGDSVMQYCPTCQNDGQLITDRRRAWLLK